ncbi:sodium-coupled monocarboxylate transporter 2-like isoform X1 [Dermacentor variabilis]|uniref:sodium-coupled monocarboxylate transporter 2-like isoform X1 n=1 Tax=Dermacentor variabilis TaxID=34621 RepID=UPI003F5BA7AE
MDDTPKFGGVDYAVLGAMLSVSSGIGLYFAWRDRRDQSNQSFLLGNRQLGLLPVSLSMMASLQSATTVLGYPAEMYYRGTQFWVAIFGLAISNVIAAEVFLPVFYRLQLTSVNSYLERRFNSIAVRLLGSLSFIVNTMLYMGVVLYGPSLALESVTGFPVWSSIVVIGLICTLYTALGGMKAVVWTDAFQMTIMLVGMLSVVVWGAMKVGGLGQVWETAVSGGRVQFFNTQLDVHHSGSLWTVLFGTTFVWLASYGTSQTQVQRFCSVSSIKKAKAALYINIPGVMINISLSCLAGLVIYAHYADCDPLKAGKISNPDQLVPYFVMKTVSGVPGLPGLFVACVFSSALSTLSSGFNSLAAVTWEDFLVRHLSLTPRQEAYVTKLVAALYGLLTIGLAFVAGTVGSILKAAFAMSGALSGPLLGVFTMGLLFPLSNKKGALAGLLLGEAMCMWVVVGSLLYGSPSEDLPTSVEGCEAGPLPAVGGHFNVSRHRSPVEPQGLLKLYHLSHLFVPVLGFCVTMTAGIIVSILTGGNGRTKDAHLYVKCVATSLMAGEEKAQELDNLKVIPHKTTGHQAWPGASSRL